MSTVTNQPANLNLLSPVAFRFSLKDIPHVNFFCQRAQVPSVSLGEVAVQTPLAAVYRAGDMTYDALSVGFIVDEDLKNYLEIHNWIKALGHPTDFQEYRDFRAGTRELPKSPNFDSNTSSTSEYVDTSRRLSDATLTVLTNKLNGNIQVNFRDCFPISLGSIDFDLTNTEISSIVVDVSFRYTSFSFETTV